MDGRRTSSVVADGYRPENEGSGESSLSDQKEEESTSVGQGSENSNLEGSLFSSELTEDVTSSSSSLSSFSGALFEFSDLMANLPVKRGLSRYYDGKSQSFTCLGRVMSLEELIKKNHRTPSNKRMKSCKTYAAKVGSTNPRHHCARRLFNPRALISKKGSRNYNSLRV